MAKQLHEKQQDLDLDLQNKHFVETPAGVVKYVTTQQLHGGLKFEDYSITRNLERGVDPSSFTNYTTAAGLGNNVCNAVYVFGNNVYVATNGGLSISTDGGVTYTNYTTANGLGSNTCNDVFVFQNNVYVATNGGVSISTDAGVTYTNYTTANGLDSNTCTDIYADGSTIYVVNGSSYISRSTDSGATYSRLVVGVSVSIYDVYAYGTTIYYITSIGGGGGLFKSIDNGLTFTRISGVITGSFVSNVLHSLFVNDNNIYVTHQDATFGGVYVSTDGGVTFTLYTTANGLGSRTTYNVFSSGGYLYVATAGGISISPTSAIAFTNYTTANGLGNNSSSSVFVLNGKAYVTSNVTGISISASLWKRIATGSGTMTEHDIATSSIDDYAAASGAAGSTATLTQIMRKTISLITSYLKFYVSNTTDTTSSTDANASLRTSGGLAVAKKIFSGLLIRTVDTTDATSSTDAAASISTAGGLAVAKKIYVGTDANIGANNIVAGATDSTSTTTGSLRTAGGLGVVKSVNIGTTLDTGGVIRSASTINAYQTYIMENATALEKARITQNNANANWSIWSNSYTSGGFLREAGYSARYLHENSSGAHSFYISQNGIADDAITYTLRFQITNNIVTTSSPLTTTDTTESTSTTTGALRSSGGLAVVKNANIGGNIYVGTQPTGWRADTYAGYGSTDTKIPYFTNVRVNNVLNTDITVVNNATNGCKITINTAGLYSVSFSFCNDGSAGGYHAGISLNSNQLTTSIFTITDSHRIAIDSSSTANENCNSSITLWLPATSIIRPHTDGIAPSAAGLCIFSIVKII